MTLTFVYGTMSSGKTLHLLVRRFQRKDKNDVLLLKPAIDTRDGQSYVASRALGLKAQVDVLIDEKTDIIKEVQTAKPGIHLSQGTIVGKDGYDVICYGLRTDFRGELFEGSSWLFAWADVLQEESTICSSTTPDSQGCIQKATFNKKITNRAANQNNVLIGADECFRPVCSKCFCDQLTVVQHHQSSCTE